MKNEKVKLTIDFLQISENHPFGKVVEWKPSNNAVHRNRTKEQRKKRYKSWQSRLSRKINAFIQNGKSALHSINK